MIVSSAEVRNNFGKYLEMAAQEEVVITQNGRIAARLLGTDQTVSFLSERLAGLVPEDVDEYALKHERLQRQ